MVAGPLGTMHARVSPAPRGAAQELRVWPHGAPSALVSSRALCGHGPNPALGCMGDIPLHCRVGTCLRTPHLPWWDFGLKPGCSWEAWLAPGCCSCQGLHAMLDPGAVGAATKQLWGQAAQCPGAQPTLIPTGPGLLSPMQRGGIAPGWSHPCLGSAWRASPKKPVPEGKWWRTVSPTPPLSPPSLGAPLQPPAPCTALSLRLSCLGERRSGGSRMGRRSQNRVSRGKRSKKRVGGRKSRVSN